MIDDLFQRSDRLERLPVPDAEIYFQSYLSLPEPAPAIVSRLIDEVPWRAETVVVWGKSYPQPRLIAWYGDIGHTYKYSGISLKPLVWTEILLTIKSKVEAAVGAAFNSVLLNYYRDNRDSMGFHSDDEPELGVQPTIASLSLGDERTLIFKHKTKSFKGPRLKLASNSLLVMKGETQKNWKHGIDKENRFCLPRDQFDLSSHLSVSGPNRETAASVTIGAISYRARCVEAACTNRARVQMVYADAGGRPIARPVVCNEHARRRLARDRVAGLKVYDDR